MIWPRLASAALGVWLAVAPSVLGYGDPARTNDRVVGPLATAAALIAICEVTRSLRRVDQALGLWLIAAPWVLGHGFVSLVDSTVVGALLVGLANQGGAIGKRYGGGWWALLEDRLLPEDEPERGADG